MFQSVLKTPDIEEPLYSFLKKYANTPCKAPSTTGRVIPTAAMTTVYNKKSTKYAFR